MATPNCCERLRTFCRKGADAHVTPTRLSSCLASCSPVSHGVCDVSWAKVPAAKQRRRRRKRRLIPNRGGRRPAVRHLAIEGNNPLRVLVPRLRLGTSVPLQALPAVLEAEPRRQCVPRLSLGTSKRAVSGRGGRRRATTRCPEHICQLHSKLRRRQVACLDAWSPCRDLEETAP
jgi:hypothetical protein